MAAEGERVVPEGLTKAEVMKIVNRYIGVNGGYLGDFSYRSHADFYSEYCNLDYDPYQLEGTTRERFIHILMNAPPIDQAAIIRGVLERFPVGGDLAPATRTAELARELRETASRLLGAASVPAPDLQTGAMSVDKALADAETLLLTSGPLSAVDRVYTALHGYLELIAQNASLPVAPDASLAAVFSVLRAQHPCLQATGGQAEHITKLLRAIGTILDTLQPIRNRGSLAHPNEALLGDAEAMLVVNTGRTVLGYIRDKLEASVPSTN